MENDAGQMRQGLPRVPGGALWPAAGSLRIEAPVIAKETASLSPTVAVEQPVPAEHPAVQPLSSVEPVRAAELSGAATPRLLRRGLPRVTGGGPWPSADLVAPSAPPLGAPASPVVERETSVPASAVAKVLATRSAATASVFAADLVPSGTALRRGLPRTAGGAHWPAEGVPRPSAAVAAVSPIASAQAPVPAAVAAVSPIASAQAVKQAAVVAPKPAPAPLEATPESQKRAQHVRSREPRVIGSRTLDQWVRLCVLGVLGLVVTAGIIVLAARGLTTLPGVPEFIERYPGEYHLPAVAEPGFPAWARWTHFLNFFLIVLIIRSGWQVRSQQKPPAFFTPRRGGKKISIYLWLHTSLDLLWLANGVVFVVLLFATGHWARIVPTSWEVFPNAASAMLQYLTLEWPVEDGWVNYNSLQQLMYFAVVFIAAPLAAITGVRMSEWWPEHAKKLNKLYPAPVARALHFPTMLFFVLFIIVHVFLVFATGALKNLNHMFAGTPEVSWAGFWWFAAGLVITTGVVIVARPLVIAPVASLFGKVTNR